MRKSVMILMIACLAMAPLAARASQPLALPVQQSAPSGPANDAVDTNKILVIGAGVIIGYLLVSTVWTIQGTTLVGAIAGGLIGSWWYENHAGELVTLDKLRGTSLLSPAALGTR
jgi:hypothetical protein